MWHHSHRFIPSPRFESCKFSVLMIFFSNLFFLFFLSSHSQIPLKSPKLINKFPLYRLMYYPTTEFTFFSKSNFDFCLLVIIFRPALKEVWRSGQTNFILDCSTENLNDILQQAQQVGLLTNQYNYIILNLDLHTIDLGPYLHSETNITGVSEAKNIYLIVSALSKIKAGVS